jgi:HAD superfamily hydrolase (TIGR01490 family)
MRKLAVFDIDGTVFRSSLFIELTEELIRQDLFPPEAKEAYEREQTRWLEREGSYEEYAKAIINSWKHLKGLHYGDFADAAKVVVGAYAKRTYRYTRDLIADLKDQDYFLLAVSHSPKTIVEPFSKRLGFDKAYGVVFEIGSQDRFTGTIAEEHLIWNKSNIVKRVVEKEGLSFAGSIGVGDTESDIPFLELVETPICFNPNQTLYRHAKRNEWKVVVERKDVVYEL